MVSALFQTEFRIPLKFPQVRLQTLDDHDRLHYPDKGAKLLEVGLAESHHPTRTLATGSHGTSQRLRSKKLPSYKSSPSHNNLFTNTVPEHTIELADKHLLRSAPMS